MDAPVEIENKSDMHVKPAGKIKIKVKSGINYVNNSILRVSDA